MIRPVGPADAGPPVPGGIGEPGSEIQGGAGEDDAVARIPDGGGGPGAAADDGAPVGPSDGEEAAFLAGERAAGPADSSPVSGEAEREEPAGELPPLEDLVNRIPAPTRALVDELFRARFVTVKRIPRSALK